LGDRREVPDRSCPAQQRAECSAAFTASQCWISTRSVIGGLLTETIAFRRRLFCVCGMRGGIRTFGSNRSQSETDRAKSSVEFDKCSQLEIGALWQRLRGLRELFHQIILSFARPTSPGLRHIDELRSSGDDPKHAALLANSNLGLSPKEVGMLFTISGASVFAMIFRRASSSTRSVESGRRS